ncbi:MAG: hypothetical protein V2B18_07555, partial [Pseudomonadota bacterium]
YIVCNIKDLCQKVNVKYQYMKFDGVSHMYRPSVPMRYLLLMNMSQHASMGLFIGYHVIFSIGDNKEVERR